MSISRSKLRSKAQCESASLCNNSTSLLLLLLLPFPSQSTLPIINTLQHTLDLLQESRALLLRADCNPKTALAAILLPSEAHHDPLLLRKPLVHRQSDLIARLTVGLVQHLVQQEIALGSAVQPPNSGHLGQFLHQPLSLLDNQVLISSHDAEVLRAQRRARQLRRGVRNVVRRLHVVQDLGDGWVGKRSAQPDAREPKRLGQRLHDDQVGPLGDPLCQRGALGRKVNVRLVQHDDAVPVCLQDRLHVFFLEQLPRRVARRAEVCELYAWVRGERFLDGGDVEVERGELEGHFDERDVVDLRGDAVHAVCGWACQDLLLAWGAESADERVDGFVRAHAYEEVLWADVLRRVGVSVAEVA